MINETGGMDECDTAAMIYQCGQEKAPNLVANVISAVEVNSSAVSKKKQHKPYTFKDFQSGVRNILCKNKLLITHLLK
jgi:hypothetical protein